MVKINKRGYMQTLEAVIALMIILGVIIFAISLRQSNEPSVPEEISLIQEAVLGRFEYDPVFKESVMYGNYGTLDTLIYVSQALGAVPPGVAAGFGVDEFVYPSNLYDFARNVYSDSRILADSDGNVRIFTLYLWYDDENTIFPCPTTIMGGLSPCLVANDCRNEINYWGSTALAYMEGIGVIGCNSFGNCTLTPHSC